MGGECEQQREAICGTRQQLWRNTVQIKSPRRSIAREIVLPPGAQVAPAAPQVPGLAAHAAAEAAVRAQQAQFPGTVGASGNIGPSGIVGASGNIGPSGLCGPTGCIAF